MKILRKPINHLNYHVYMNEQMSDIRSHPFFFCACTFVFYVEEDFHTPHCVSH